MTRILWRVVISGYLPYFIIVDYSMGSDHTFLLNRRVTYEICYQKLCDRYRIWIYQSYPRYCPSLGFHRFESLSSLSTPYVTICFGIHFYRYYSVHQLFPSYQALYKPDLRILMLVLPHQYFQTQKHSTER